jgi:hypothetical protein
MLEGKLKPNTMITLEQGFLITFKFRALCTSAKIQRLSIYISFCEVKLNRRGWGYHVLAYC